MKSTHSAIVIPIKLETAVNSDSLSIVRPFGLYQVVVKTQDWLNAPLGVYIPPENLVPVSRSEFSFLAQRTNDSYFRVSTMKFRGNVSQGLLIPAPVGSKEGDDLTEFLGIKHHDTEPSPDGNTVKGINISKYDVDSGVKYVKYFSDNDECVVHEKIHGCNTRIYWDGQTMYAGGRTQWIKEDPNNSYWKCVNNYPGVVQFIRDYPDYILYGEAYGWVSPLRYGAVKGEIRFAAFDIRKPDTTYLDYDVFKQLCLDYQIPMVPELFRGNHNFAAFKPLANGLSTLYNGHCREGVVVKTVTEKVCPEGRMIYKIIGEDYNEKN